MSMIGSGTVIKLNNMQKQLDQKDARIKELEGKCCNNNCSTCLDSHYEAASYDLRQQLKSANDLLIYIEAKFMASSCHCERPAIECTTCKVKRKLNEYQNKYPKE